MKKAILLITILLVILSFAGCQIQQIRKQNIIGTKKLNLKLL